MKRREFIAVLGGAAGCFAAGRAPAQRLNPAVAGEILATNLDFLIQTVDGSPAVCEIKYEIIFHDRTKPQGTLTRAYGSMAWMLVAEKLSMRLKISGVDFDRTQTPITTYPTINGFLSLDGKPITPMLTSRCESPQQFCAAYSPEAAMQVYASLLPAGMRPAELRLGFQRQPDGLSYVLPFELDLESFASEKFRSFVDCMKTISDRGRN